MNDNENMDSTPKDTAQMAPEAVDAAPPAEAEFIYSLVLVEVIFQTDKEVRTHRVQLFSKADIDAFPADRLAQLQNSAATQAKNDVNEKSFKALEAVILNITNLGVMTDVQFWGKRASVPHADDVAKVTEPAPEQASVDASDNVVQIKRP